MTTEYFAGIFDGEGSLLITCHYRSDVKKNHYRGYIQFTNTNPQSVASYVRHIDSLGLPRHIRRDDRSKKGRKLCYQVIIPGLGGQKRWLQEFIPWLDGKKAEAEKLLEFINYRLDANAACEGIRRKDGTIQRARGKAPFTERDAQFARDIRLLRDYTRSHHLVDDIVRPDSKKPEKP